ncbi:MAG: Tol-Pal system protein TolB [Rickettsiaceae bacterium H1]|nr:Tol-Pal system protein TolB [Rickettsiaceae bacterium H1]
MVKRLIIFFLFLSFNLEARIKVDINRGNTENITIAFSKANFGNQKEGELLYEILKVVKSDLTRSSLFKVTKDLSLQLDEKAQIFPENLNGINAVSVVITSIESLENDNIEVKYRLWDVHTKKQLLGKSLKTNKNNYRRIGHMTADAIYHRMTGEGGYFDTRIAYIAKYGGKKRIAIMDQDGFNKKFLTDGSNLVLTPRFSPESQRIVYMSYADDIPAIYMRDINSHTEELIGNFSGIKSAPRFSPDGKSILMARSIDGETDIYDIKLPKHEKKRLTGKSAINTSPSYSPDQKNIVFNSDRNGSPQLYVMNSYGRKQHKITSGRGSYSSPVWSPRGDWIAFSKVIDGEFHIGVIKPDGSGERLLTTGYLVESPSWSPNGRIIIFTKQTKARDGKTKSKLYSIDFTGENERLVYTDTDASDPSWSPLLL